MRILRYTLLAALGSVALVRADEPKPDTPVLTLPGRVVIKTDGKEVGEVWGRTIAVAFNSDGKRLASAASNGGSNLVGRVYPQIPAKTTNDLPHACLALKLWDARDGKELRDQIDGFPAGVAAFSHDGKQLVVAYWRGGRPDDEIPSENIKLWEVARGKELLSLKGHEKWIESLAISSDGKSLAAGGASSGTKVWDTKSGKELYTFGGLSGEAFCMAFSPDGKRLAVGTRNFADQIKAGGIRGEVKFWDLTTGKDVATWKPLGQYVRTLAYSPDGKQLALGLHDPGAVRIWDADSGRELFILPDQPERSPEAQAQKLAYSPDSRRLAVVVSEQGKTAVKVWDATTGKLLWTLPVETADCCVAFAPDGARLAVGGPRGVAIWEVGR
jgi:WD40 repeat protein